MMAGFFMTQLNLMDHAKEKGMEMYSYATIIYTAGMTGVGEYLRSRRMKNRSVKPRLLENILHC